MATETKIPWCDHTFNPWRGCAKVSPGCAHCYAEATSKRNPAVLGTWGANGTRVVASESTWADPIKWDRAAQAAGERRRVFCASLADVFEDWAGPMVQSNGKALTTNPASVFWWRDGMAPSLSGERPATMNDARERLFSLIDDCPNLDWLLATKRPENVRRFWPGGYLFNVWLLASVEDQATADLRVPELLTLRALAPVLGLSMEPLLGPVDISPWLEPAWTHGPDPSDPGWDSPTVDWVIVGGESGPRARPCDLAWIRSIVDQCRSAGVPCFVKQLGANLQRSSPYIEGHAYAISRMLMTDPKGGDPAEWPEELRVREFPTREEAP